MATAKQDDSTQIVLGVLRDLHNMRPPTAREAGISRESVQAACAQQGLTQTVVDDRLRVLVGDGLVYRLRRGDYRPAYVHHEPRAISKTVLPDGTVALELGDVVLHLTPQEDRILAQIQAGAAAQLTAIEANYHASLMVGEFSRRLANIERASASAARKRKPARAAEEMQK